MGQQGKFLLNKVGYSTPWKINITNTFDKKNLFFKYLLISLMIEFLIRKNIYFFFLNKNSHISKNFKNYDEQKLIILRIQKKLKKYSKKTYTSQINTLYLNSWYIIRINIYQLVKNKKIKERLIVESFLRLKLIYSYLASDLNKF